MCSSKWALNKRGEKRTVSLCPQPALESSGNTLVLQRLDLTERKCSYLLKVE